ncbi:hypothetical protein PAAG_12561 [Paracoccidioides lutzii Pb01]|uniref:Uncharacterized protein n=1 Tax=Paracoccidioides lutzii (strain ATCC MYA-826 / Pb01) TaxID=502779 RepID=A0A0A2UYX4_PARBA|nr:hypothetical protein PAAG_12561 [Paracoccidioides lutzii Pb01]KGQ00766.1 hypothetical protein PAAG_12561 [Paracoccidioides lutzii Pb01]
MSTPNASDMITMSIADLLIFCQQMTCQNTSNINNDTSVNDFKSQIHEYQKDVQRAIDIKTVTIFNDTNYQIWQMRILADAEVISGTDILIKNQHICSNDISQNVLNTEK